MPDLLEVNETKKSSKSSIQNITLSILLYSLESLDFCTYADTEEYYETLGACHIPQKLKFWKERILSFQSSNLLIENYSQNQCQYCLKYDLIKSRQNYQKEKKPCLQLHLKPPIFNANPNNIKLQMLQEWLKCKQHEEKTQSI